MTSGVSLIVLVITIIVVIILAAIAFGTSTRTISNINDSDYINNIGELRSAFHARAVTIKGEEAAKGNNVTDAQVYNYLAKNGQSQGDFLVKADLPAYSVIQDGGQIGMALPKMKVESALGKMVEVKWRSFCFNYFSFQHRKSNITERMKEMGFCEKREPSLILISHLANADKNRYNH